MNVETYVRHFLLAMAGIAVGLMSVSLLFDLAIYRAPHSPDVEQDATRYYQLVRSSFVPIIVVGTLLGFVAATTYRIIFVRNWRTYLIAAGVFSLSAYYVTTIFELEDRLPYIVDFEERVDALRQIGAAHLLTWLAGWMTILLLLFEPDTRRERQ